MKEKIKDLQKEVENLSAPEILKWAEQRFGAESVALANSFGIEDMILMQMIAENSSIQVFTLDTGRVFQETYNVWDRAVEKYKLDIEPLFPDKDDVEKMMKEKGPNSFYLSVENRKECCRIRKIKPLKRKLSTLKGWITGLRREQSKTREKVQKVEWDESNGLIKINPLAEWSEQECRDYAGEKRVPLNVLHKKGYPSIGCMPCTRPVKAGEDARSGRWWWEIGGKQECGLHHS